MNKIENISEHSDYVENSYAVEKDNYVEEITTDEFSAKDKKE